MTTPVIISGRHDTMPLCNHPDTTTMTECDRCGALAVTERKATLGVHSLCETCDAHLQETLADNYNCYPDEEFGICEDCHEFQADCVFRHFDGRRFQLCAPCWQWADHDDDYLMFCECEVPDCTDGTVYCRQCQYEVRSWYHCLVSCPPEYEYEEDYDADNEGEDEEETELSEEDIDEIVDRALELYNPLSCI